MKERFISQRDTPTVNPFTPYTSLSMSKTDLSGVNIMKVRNLRELFGRYGFEKESVPSVVLYSSVRLTKKFFGGAEEELTVAISDR